MQAEQAYKLKVKSNYTVWRRVFLFIICGLFFFWSFQQIIAQNTITFDSAIRETINGWEISLVVDFFYLFTVLGDKAGVITIMILAILVIWWKTKDYVAMGVLVSGVIVVNELNKWLKDFTGRERPMTGPGAESLSFPSGHAMVGLFFYGLLLYLLLLYTKARGRRLLILVSGITFILLLGSSRIFLNYHYPSDVFAGYAAGYICLLFGVLAYEGLQYFLTKKSA
ncbi:phosphatase PAP2 family protein [Sutcliffiella deserti]|uniref:phosphatase PAP2 family protein n=1 Tax=Sutcliffiella deserti TaxID=2875501 RepID=UPI001CBF13B3|nr:phosphatase PAP2 family protein [Sutcliffiella deserti]